MITHSTTLRSITIADAVDQFMEEKRQGEFSEHHLRTLEGRLLHLSRTVGRTLELSELSRGLLWSYLCKRGTPRTQINHLASIKLLLSWARDSRYLPEDRRTVAETIKIKAKNTDPEFYTPAEMRQLLAAASGLDTEFHCLIVLLVLGGFCGLRTAELGRLRWIDIQIQHKAIKMNSLITKTNRRRMVKIPENAIKWLALAIPHHAQGLILPLEWQYNLHRHTGRVANEAGVAWKLNGLRHSYATYAVAHSRNVAEVAENMGNTPAVLQVHYKGLAHEADAAEWFDITPDNTL